jgi:ADP-heptose:LPS heptosyltransferase
VEPTRPLVAPELLAQADRILFVTHLAIGDFTYLQSGLRAFAAAYPHLKIDIWVDERRRTNDLAAWAHLRNYALFDWLAACPWIHKVYKRTYSPAALAESIDEAQRAAYPLVVALTVLDCHRYARLARTISPRGFIVGLKKPAERMLHAVSRRAGYRKLDATLPVYTRATSGGLHISDIYAGWFQTCFGLEIAPAARRPLLDIPEGWMYRAQTQLLTWGFGAAPVVFINAYSKSPDRTWPLERVVALIRAMQAQAEWRGAAFVVNTVPEALADARRVLERQADPVFARVRLFSADEHFFQLPALMRLCHLVISVETAVMHLANAVHVPVVALMRCNHPEWAPIDKVDSTVIWAPTPEDWVTSISVDDVLTVLAARHRQAPPAAAASRLPARPNALPDARPTSLAGPRTMALQ